GGDDVVSFFGADAGDFARVVVKGHIDALDIGKVGGDDVIINVDQPVLHILGVGEGNIVDNVEFFQENGADQPIHVRTGNKAISFPRTRFQFRRAHGSSLLAVTAYIFWIKRKFRYTEKNTNKR